MNEEKNEEKKKGVPLEDEKIEAVTEHLLDREIDRVYGGARTIGRFQFGDESAAREEKLASPVPLAPTGPATSRAPQGTPSHSSIVKPIRTFERDIAESIRSKGASTASINLAEQERVQKVAGFGQNTEREAALGAQKRERVARSGLLFIASVVLIIAAAGILLTVFVLFKEKAPPAVPPQYSTISAEKIKEIDVTGATREELISLLRGGLKDRTELGSLTEIKLTEAVGGVERRQISAEKFFSILAGSAPSSLSRALGGKWTFGFQSGTRAEPFILTGVASFDNAYDGMLRWEALAASDLREIFLEYERSVGTTTSERVVAPQLKNSFEDLVVKSKNTRVLRDVNGNIALLYSFLNEEYLVITTNENVFKEILNRFLSSRLVR